MSQTPTSTIRTSLKSQYHAALATLREAIELCPDALWDRQADRNRSWQIAYHALFVLEALNAYGVGTIRQAQ